MKINILCVILLIRILPFGKNMKNSVETREFFVDLLNSYLKETPPVRCFLAQNFYRPHSGDLEIHRFAVLDIPLSGQKHIKFGNRKKLCEYHLLPGDVLCTPAKVWKEPLWDCGHKLLCIVFTDKYLRVTFLDNQDGENGIMPACRKYFHTFHAPPEVIRYTLNAFLAAGENEPGIRIGLLSLLLEECRDFLAADSVLLPGGKGERTFQLVRQYLLENFNRPLTREETAEHFHLNCSYLSRLFREKCNRSFSEELRLIRMEHAAFLLLNTDCLIDDIAMQCGLSSTPSFTAAFKAVYGVPPGTFRRK